jgi:hypothetical protein
MEIAIHTVETRMGVTRAMKITTAGCQPITETMTELRPRTFTEAGLQV